MAEFDYAKQEWRRQVGAPEELPWTRGARILEFQPLIAFGAALTGGIQGTLGPWLTAAIVLAFGYGIVWVDRLQLPEALREPVRATAWSAFVPPAYLAARAARFRGAGVERPSLPLWIALVAWAVAVVAWIAVWSATGTPWGFISW